MKPSKARALLRCVHDSGTNQIHHHNPRAVHFDAICKIWLHKLTCFAADMRHGRPVAPPLGSAVHRLSRPYLHHHEQHHMSLTSTSAHTRSSACIIIMHSSSCWRRPGCPQVRLRTRHCAPADATRYFYTALANQNLSDTMELAVYAPAELVSSTAWSRVRRSCSSAVALPRWQPASSSLHLQFLFRGKCVVRFGPATPQAEMGTRGVVRLPAVSQSFACRIHSSSCLLVLSTDTLDGRS